MIGSIGRHLTSSDFSLPGVLTARRSAIIAAIIGTVSGAMAWALMARPGYAPDFFHYWSATRTLLEGANPYHVIPAGPLNPGADPVLYPLPAMLLLVPFALLPLPVAGGAFVGLSAALAAWGVARTGAERLPLFVSAPFILAVSLGQWSPLMVAAALLPAVAPVVITKPNVGAAVWISRPLPRTAVIGVLLLAASLLVLPTWPMDWIANVSGREEKFVPLTRPLGFTLLLAAIAWRRAEARLLTAMAVVPQALFFYDQLLLALIPRTLRQSIVFAGGSLILFLVWRARLVPGDFEVREAVPFAYGIYVLALTILLWNFVRDRPSGRSRSGIGEPAVTPPSAAGGPVESGTRSSLPGSQ